MNENYYPSPLSLVAPSTDGLLTEYICQSNVPQFITQKSQQTGFAPRFAQITLKITLSHHNPGSPHHPDISCY